MRGFGMMGAIAALAAATLSFPLPRDGFETPPERRDRKRNEQLQERERRRREDPFFGIAGKGRSGAAKRAKAQAEALAKTRIGKRNARGRGLSNPFKTEDNRGAFDLALTSVAKFAGNPNFIRAQAARSVRRRAA